MKRLSVLIPLTFFFFALSGPASQRVAISGSTVDPSDRPVGNVDVQLAKSTGAAILTTRSNQAGQFVINEVAPGDYLLTASTEKLALPHPLAVNVTKSQGEPLTLKLDVTAQRNQITVTAAALPQSVDLVSKALDVVRGRGRTPRRVLGGGCHSPGARASHRDAGRAREFHHHSDARSERHRYGHPDRWFSFSRQYGRAGRRERVHQRFIPG